MEYFSYRSGKILDLGGGDGSFFISRRKKFTNFDIYIADIDEKALMKAKIKGFKTILLRDDDRLPFSNDEFDIVFCNSVIEHYTGKKKEVIRITNHKKFNDIAFSNQKILAAEINRISKAYFVQTPNKYFVVESHTHFPLLGFFKRPLQVFLIKLLNKFWIKKTQPDWRLLNKKDMKSLFPNAKIVTERIIGMPKSFIAIRY